MAAWPQVTIQRRDTPVKRINYGNELLIEVAVKLNGLNPDDVLVELVLGRPLVKHGDASNKRHHFTATGTTDASGAHIYALELKPELCGSLDYQIRAFPWHELLTHPLEMGLMAWV